MRKLLIPSLFLLGCAHSNVPRALETAQVALAAVDVGTEKGTTAYMTAVQVIRQHCNGDAQCEEKYHVTDDDVAKAAVTAQALGQTYDSVARLLAELGKSWGAFAVEVAEKESIADGLAK